MKKKVITYEEVKISEDLKAKCRVYLQNNPITIYWDYRDELDLEQIEKLMKSQEDYYELESDIWENNIDYIYDFNRPHD